MEPADLTWEYLDARTESAVATQFARYGLAVDYETLPDAVVKQAKRSILDSLGCALGALDADGFHACLELIEQLGGVEEATVFGTGRRTNAVNAALANSFLIRYLDFNDSGGGGHNSDAIPSILAVGEREQASGRAFLTSVVVSYELGKRFREGIQAGSLGREAFHTAGVTNDLRGGLNVPPALGPLLGMEEHAIANAIGICASRNAPLKILDADVEELTGTKNLRLGGVAADAIRCCLLAESGLTGPISVVEGDQGIIEGLFDGEAKVEPMLDFAGWRILDTDYKTISANSTSHGHILATQRIVETHDLGPDDIDRIEIRASPREVRHTTSVGRKYPRNAETANHSAHFANAVVVRDGEFGPAAFDSATYEDPVILDLIGKINVEVDPNLPVRSLQGTSSVTTVTGETYTETIRSPPGYGDRLAGGDVDAAEIQPLSDEALERKFRGMAQEHLEEDHIDDIIDTVWHLEALADVGELARLMVVE